MFGCFVVMMMPAMVVYFALVEIVGMPVREAMVWAGLAFFVVYFIVRAFVFWLVPER